MTWDSLLLREVREVCEEEAERVCAWAVSDQCVEASLDLREEFSTSNSARRHVCEQ